MKRIIAIIACVVVLCSCLVIPAFAVTDPFTGEYVLSAPFSSIPSSSNLKVSPYQVSSRVYAVAQPTNTDYVFCCIVNGSTTFISLTNNQSIWYLFDNNATTSRTITNYQSGVYHWETLSNTTSVNDYPTFSSFNDAASFFLNYDPNESTNIYNEVSIPAGNVAYIKTNGSQVLDLSTTFIQYSQLFSDTWANITQKISYEDSLPIGNVTFPLNGMSSIQWVKTGSTNILGQTQNASASYQTTSNQYFVIYNPLYQQYGQGNNYDMNGTIQISGEMTEIKVYPLSGSVVTGQGLVSSSDSEYGNYFEWQDDGNGNPGWVDQSGNVSSGPQTGGTSLLPQEATIQSLASQILNIITKVGQSIANIFNVGHQAIVTLVGHASEFVTHFQSLYTWLPADIFAVLSSAIILAITIGIIKVFI